MLGTYIDIAIDIGCIDIGYIHIDIGCIDIGYIYTLTMAVLTLGTYIYIDIGYPAYLLSIILVPRPTHGPRKGADGT